MNITEFQKMCVKRKHRRLNAKSSGVYIYKEKCEGIGHILSKKQLVFKDV